MTGLSRMTALRRPLTYHGWGIDMVLEPSTRWRGPDGAATSYFLLARALWGANRLVLEGAPSASSVY